MFLSYRPKFTHKKWSLNSLIQRSIETIRQSDRKKKFTRHSYTKRLVEEALNMLGVLKKNGQEMATWA